MTWAILGGFFVALAVLLWGAVTFHVRWLSARRTVNFLARVSSSDSPGQDALLGRRARRLAASPKMQRVLADFPLVEQTAEELDASGLSWTVAQMGVYTVVLFVGGIIIPAIMGLPVARSFVLGVFMAFLPTLYVSRRRSKRARAFEAQLPQVLELIALYLRSGRSLPQAFVGATEEILPPASEELMAAADEYRLGRPLDVSLKQLASRYPTSLGFRLFAIAVSVLGQTGGNLVEVLERIKRTLDAGITYGLRLNALTGESRTSAWILGALPAVFFVIISMLSEGYNDAMFNNDLGRYLFGTIVFLWGSGILWIRAMMRAKII